MVVTIRTAETPSPLPQPACSAIDQLTKVLNLTGTPNPSLVQKMQSKDVSSLFFKSLLSFFYTDSSSYCLFDFRHNRTSSVFLHRRRRTSGRCFRPWTGTVSRGRWGEHSGVKKYVLRGFVSPSRRPAGGDAAAGSRETADGQAGPLPPLPGWVPRPRERTGLPAVRRLLREPGARRAGVEEWVRLYINIIRYFCDFI